MSRLKGIVNDAAAPAAQWRWKLQFSEHVARLALSPDGSLVAVATLDGEVAIVSTADGRRIRDLPRHGFGALDVAWSPDGAVLATAGQDGVVRVLDGASGDVLGEHRASGWASRVVHRGMQRWQPRRQRYRSGVIGVTLC